MIARTQSNLTAGIRNALLLGVSALLTPALGQTWDGGGSNSNWGTANNWNPNSTPANNGSANVTFAAGNLFNSSTSTVNTAWDVNSITFTGILSSHTIGGSALTVRSSVTHSGFISSATFNNNLVLVNQVAFNPAGATTTITVNGAISGSGGLTKNGAGTLNLAAGNTFSGSLILNAGSLVLTASNAIANSTPVVLNGGTFNFNGKSDTLGSLTLNGNSTLDLGSSGNSIVQFASASWTGGTLTIDNWNGSTTGGGSDQILFSSTPSQAFLDQVYWADLGITGAKLVGQEIVPVPEPSAIIGGSLLLLLAGVQLYRRHRAAA